MNFKTGIFVLSISMTLVGPHLISAVWAAGPMAVPVPDPVQIELTYERIECQADRLVKETYFEDYQGDLEDNRIRKFESHNPKVDTSHVLLLTFADFSKFGKVGYWLARAEFKGLVKYELFKRAADFDRENSLADFSLDGQVEALTAKTFTLKRELVSPKGTDDYANTLELKDQRLEWANKEQKHWEGSGTKSTTTDTSACKIYFSTDETKKAEDFFALLAKTFGHT